MASNNVVNFGYNKTDNIPKMAYIKNNGGSNDINCLNFIYMPKDASGKSSWNYVCRFKGCGASISLKIGLLETDQIGVLEPFQPTYLKINHRGHEVK